MTEGRAAGGGNRADGSLDVFALPAETTFRFILLVLVTLAAGFFVANWLFLSLGGGDQETQTTLRCGRLVNELGAADGAATPILADCTDPIQQRSGLAGIAGAVAILGLGGLACCIAPAVRMRRRRLRPLRDDVPAVVEAVEKLCGEVGVRRSPEPVWNPLVGGTSALAFGAFGRHRIALGGGLVATHFRDPGRFQAVLMHELAHVRNRDVTLTYMSVFVWWAFVLAGVVPFIFTLFDEGGDTILDLGWRLAALTALVYLGRNAVLRAREAYADARAARWLGSPEPLMELLGSSGGTPPARRSPRGAVRALRGFVAVHPAPSLRARLLSHPDGLMRLSPFVGLAAGIAAGVSFSEAQDATTLVATGSAESLATTWAALATVPLAIGVVVVAAWRATMAAAAARRLPPTGLVAGIAVAAGLFMGGLIAPGEAFQLPGQSVAGWVDVIWAGAVAVLAALFTGLAVIGAEAWLGTLRGARAARTALVMQWIVTGAAFAWLVGQAVPLVEVLKLPESPGLRAVILYVTTKEVTLAVLAAVAVFPFVAQLIRGRALLPWRTAIVAVAAAALAFLLVAVAWRLIVHNTVSLPERKTNDFLFHYQNSHEAIAVGLAAAAACGVALRGGRRAAPLGLLVALATAGLAVAAFLGLVTAASCAESLSIVPPRPQDCPTGVAGSYFWDTIVNWGSEAMLLAMVAMLASLLVRHLAGRARAAPAPAPAAIATPAPRPTVAHGERGLALPLATVCFGVAGLAGVVAVIALARAETPAIGVPTAARQLSVPEQLSGTGTWTDKLEAACIRAATDIRKAARAPAGQAQAAVAQRVRVLISQLKRIRAPVDARVDDAAILLGFAARRLDFAAAALAQGDRATAWRYLRTATRDGRGAEIYLAEKAGALECTAIGF
jgi:Zn-dependent protease with chaperone function